LNGGHPFDHARVVKNRVSHEAATTTRIPIESTGPGET
jgi:hypothetical protein